MLAWREQWFGSRTLGRVLPEVLGVPETELGMDHGGAQEIVEAIDVDTTFAEMMIPHHEGAVAMAEVASDKAQHHEVKGSRRESRDWRVTPRRPGIGHAFWRWRASQP